MFTRSLLTSALPTSRPKRGLRRVELRVLLRRLAGTAGHSQRIQARVEHSRQASVERHASGRKPNA
jgi:hypothetical protein